MYERPSISRVAHGFARAFLLALAAAAAAHGADGAAVYRARCSACHESGAGEAPRSSVAADWADRFAAGRAAMHAAAIRGVPNTAMAPKGGFAELSDEEVRAAVDYMLSRAGFVDDPGMGPARAQEHASGPARAAAADAAAPDASLLRRVAEAVRDAVAAPATPVENHGNEHSIRGSGIRVSAEGGVVRLTGVAANGATIKRAEDAARSVAGVGRLENRLIAGGMLDFD
jgi:cytochrome c5